MQKIRVLLSLLLLLTVITACTPAEETVLSVAGKDYTPTELKALGTTTAAYTNKDGEKTTYEGVPLAAVLEDADLTKGEIVFTAADGYEAELPVEEALACKDCLIAFNDNSLLLVMPDFSSKLQVKDLLQISVK